MDKYGGQNLCTIPESRQENFQSHAVKSNDEITDKNDIMALSKSPLGTESLNKSQKSGCYSGSDSRRLTSKGLKFAKATKAIVKINANTFVS